MVTRDATRPLDEAILRRVVQRTRAACDPMRAADEAAERPWRGTPRTPPEPANAPTDRPGSGREGDDRA